MAFTDFKSIAQVQSAFQIKYTEQDYIQGLNSIKPSESFIQELAFSRQYMDIFSSEASRCENVIYPILREAYKHYADKYTLWSHKTLNYDTVLTGTPDYMIATKSALGKTVLDKPLLVMVEAKQNNFSEGWGQCLAELLAAQKINQSAKTIQGIVTDGELWQFAKLTGDTFIKHISVFTLTDLAELFSALAYVFDEAGKE
ncbi:MAG: hypothetical protein KDI39_10900 [Pseudomonadales bacterium]|nr:hypothetical protein [Pseudomonadales bacterium]